MILPELGTFLQTGGHGTLGTDLFTGWLPSSPDACVALLESGGFEPEGDFGTDNVRYEFPRVQVTVRHTDYATGRLKIDAVVKALQGVRNESLSGVYYVGAWPVQSPFLLEQDANGRWVFVCNVQVTKSPSSS